jgi:predicted dehydrogenase
LIRIGVIGYGYWGPNVVRNFFETPGAQLACVCDLRADRLALVRSRYPSVEVTQNAFDLLNDPTINAIVIATPVSTHYEMALEALRRDKHVFVEKPLAASSEQVLRLMEVAEKKERVLLVDHTFVYTGAVRKIRELIENGGLGQIYYYDSVRVNLGLFQHDVNVIWDLAVHDLSIMDYVLPFRPYAVSATGLSHVSGGTENIAYLTLFFRDSLIAHIHVNWLAPVKLRRTLIGASRKMIVYDDLEQSEKIKIYDKGITVNSHQNPDKLYQILVSYRTGDMLAPQIDISEALRSEAEHFVRCIAHGETPITGGEAGLRVVRILEAATQSMREHGRPVELEPAAVIDPLRMVVPVEGRASGLRTYAKAASAG